MNEYLKQYIELQKQFRETEGDPDSVRDLYTFKEMCIRDRALVLLAPHEEHFAEDHCWNYRIASAYYFLDEEGPALRYFEKALKARPGDKDTQEYIDDCRRRLSLPRFEKNFRERTQEGWAAFSQIEAELRQIIETDETHQRGEELVEKCGNALKTALRDTSFELGFSGEKYELILSPEGLRSRLFQIGRAHV